MLSDQPASELLVVDGTNVCFWYGQAFKDWCTGEDRASIRPLLVLLAEIRAHGDNFYCIFDASTARHIARRGKFEDARLIDELVRRYPRHFFCVTRQSSADAAVVHFAHRHNCRIVTNDTRYGDRFGVQCPWLRTRHSPRLIHGNFQRTGQMTLERLDYGFMEVPWEMRTGEMLQRLAAALAAPRAPRPITVEAQVLAVNPVGPAVGQQEQKLGGEANVPRANRVRTVGSRSSTKCGAKPSASARAATKASKQTARAGGCAKSSRSKAVRARTRRPASSRTSGWLSRLVG